MQANPKGLRPEVRTSRSDSPDLTADAARPVQSTRAQKLNQVVQNFYSKAAQIIIQARQPVTPLYARNSTIRRLNKWFNLDTADTDAFRDELQLWRSVNVSSDTFMATRPLVIEVVLSFRDLTSNQRLTLVDGRGQRADVAFHDSFKRYAAGEIVLERWVVDWERPSAKEPPELAVTYKKSIAVFRSLYTLCRLLPAWKLRQRLFKSKLSSASLKVSCRVSHEANEQAQEAYLKLHQSAVPGSHSQVNSFAFHAVETQTGKLKISVQYRQDSDFRVDDTEALLSSHFVSADVLPYRPQSSLPTEAARRPGRSGPGANMSSLPYLAQTDSRTGSTSSVHKIERRSSFAIHPFKSPSLSASPTTEAQGPSRLASRTHSNISVERTSQRAASYQQASRPVNSESMALSASGSPRLSSGAPPSLKRYSSSFGQRTSSFSGRRRPSQMSESVAQLKSEHTSGTSSRSDLVLQTSQPDEQDGLDEFMKLLEAPEPLKGINFGDSVMHHGSRSSEPEKKMRSELDRYHKLRESHAALSDSLVQSTILRTTPRAAVRRMSQHSPSLHSGGSSPGKPMSPHTPAIPSRLSETSIMPRPVSQRRDDALQIGIVSENGASGPVQIPAPTSPNGSDGRRPYGDDHDGESMPPIDTKLSNFRQHEESATQPFETSDPRIGKQHTMLAQQMDRSSTTKGYFAARGTIAADSGCSREQRDQPTPQSPPDRIGSAVPAGSHVPRASSTTGTPDDDDLFFAMSDIHLSRI